MSCSDKIKQGDTGPIWHITVPEIDQEGLATGNVADLTNYTCSLVVGTETQTVTVMNTTSDAFLAQISSVTSDLLDAGGYNVGIEVRDDTITPPYVSEIHKQIQIATQLVE
jgi:hypothetical protein